MNSKEIERKFLVKRLPSDLERCPAASIRQGYLAIASDGNEVRIRSKGDRFFLTVKDSGRLTRMELEIEISAEQFNVLWPATEGRRVVKTRYNVSHGDHTIEVDLFHDSLANLMTAEVEFASEAASRAFQPPDWLGADVTEDDRYKNKSLASRGAPDRDG